MSSFFNKLLPYYVLWLEGWCDFFSNLPFVRRKRTYILADGTAQTWSDGHWTVGAKGRHQGRLVTADKVLLRSFSLPVSSVKRIQTAVDAEVLVSSPFPAESTSSGFVSSLTPQGQLLVEVAIFHRRELHALGLVDPIYARGTLGPIPIRVRPSHLGAGLTWALWLGVAVVGVSIVVMPLLGLRQQAIVHIQAFDRLQKSTAQVQLQREVLQQQLTQYQQLVVLQENHPDPLLVLDRLSAALPDSSHLVLFTLKAQQISLEGQTPNALTLLNQLQNAQGFAAVQLSGAVQRHAQSGKDVFQMQMRFQP